MGLVGMVCVWGRVGMWTYDATGPSRAKWGNPVFGKSSFMTNELHIPPTSKIARLATVLLYETDNPAEFET